MKKSTKRWLGAAGILMALGIVICTIATANGGFNQVVVWVENGELSFHTGNWELLGWDDDDELIISQVSQGQQSYSGTVSDTVLADSMDVSELKVEVTGGTVILTKSSDDSFHFSSSNAISYRCFVDGKTVYLLSDTKIVRTGSRITLAIPEGVTLNDIDLSLGGGELEAERLSAGTIELELGAGSFMVEELITDDVSLEIGAGTATIKNGVIRDGDFSVGLGELYYEGSISGDIEADVSMGALTLRVDGEENDFNYEVDCSMGHVSVGRNTSIEAVGSRTIDNGASSNMDLSCSMGELSVSFH